MVHRSLDLGFLHQQPDLKNSNSLKIISEKKTSGTNMKKMEEPRPDQTFDVGTVQNDP